MIQRGFHSKIDRVWTRALTGKGPPLAKRNNAIVLGGTSDKMFAVGTFLLSFFEHNPSISTDVIIFHNGISEEDRNALSKIHPCRFIEYQSPFASDIPWHKNVNHFTHMVFSKYECLNLLEEYRTVIWFDYDMIVANSLDELFDPVPGGLKLIAVEKVSDFVLGDISNPELERHKDAVGVHASCMAFYDTLPNYKSLYQWCLDATTRFAADLGCPDQVVFSAMVDEFKLDVYPLCFELYSPHPAKRGTRRSDRYAKIWHSYRTNKYWDSDFEDTSWNSYFARYLEIKYQRALETCVTCPNFDNAENLENVSIANAQRDGQTVRKFSPTPGGGFSQSDILWDLRSGKDVAIEIRGAYFPVENPEVLHIILEEFVDKGLIAEARAINVALIGLEAHLRRSSPLSTPRVIQLETTNVCNAECIMCEHFYSGNKGAKHADLRVFESLRSTLPLVEGLVLHGYGEPFVNPHLEEILSLLDANHILVSTNTNLSVLPSYTYEKYAHLFHGINVSCDACTKELYEGIRKKLNFDTFVANASRLRSLFPKTHLTLAVTVMRQNLDNLSDLVQFAHDMRFDEITFNEMAPDIIIGNYIDTPHRSYRRSCAAMKAAVEMAASLGLSVSAPMQYLEAGDDEPQTGKLDEFGLFPSELFQRRLMGQFSQNPNQMSKYNSSLLESLTTDFPEFTSLEGVCDWVVEKSYIDINGNVFPCCTGYPQHGDPLGNVFDSDFSEIWRGEAYQKMRSMFYAGQIPCGCNGCCFIRSGSLPMLRVGFSESGIPKTHIKQGAEAELFAAQQGSKYESDLRLASAEKPKGL